MIWDLRGKEVAEGAEGWAAGRWQTDDHCHQRPGEFPGRGRDFMKGTSVLPTDAVIMPHWALGSVRSPCVICCSGELPGQSPGSRPPSPSLHTLGLSFTLHSIRDSALPLGPTVLVRFQGAAGVLPMVTLPWSPDGHQPPSRAWVASRWEGFQTMFRSLGKRSRDWLESPKVLQISSHSLPAGNPPLSSFSSYCYVKSKRGQELAEYLPLLTLLIHYYRCACCGQAVPDT